jgi:hypothetical protein
MNRCEHVDFEVEHLQVGPYGATVIWDQLGVYGRCTATFVTWLKVKPTYTGWWCNNHLETSESQWEG